MKSLDKFLERIANKKLLVIFPHPDDESVMAGGLIIRALQKNFDVTVLTLTEGNRGQIHIHGKGRSVAEIRRHEMANAMSKLGVSDFVLWKFDDGYLRKTQKWRARVREVIKEINPGIVVSYDFSGVTAHPDHISLSLEIFRILKKQKKIKLLWTSFTGIAKVKMVDKRTEKYLSKPKYKLDLTLSEARRKWQAVFEHKSQNLGGYLGDPWWLLMFVMKTEWYSEADFSDKYKYKFVKFKI